MSLWPLKTIAEAWKMIMGVLPKVVSKSMRLWSWLGRDEQETPMIAMQAVCVRMSLLHQRLTRSL